MSEESHYGYDQSGIFSALHKGLQKDCSAPECATVTYENLVARANTMTLPEDWGVWCPHGKHIVVRDTENADPEGWPVGKAVDPWPCHEPGCTLAAFEDSELRAFEESLPDYYEMHGE